MPNQEPHIRMLVLDPHLPSRKLLLRYLQKHDIEGTEAATFNEAKDRFADGLFQAVAFQCPLPDAAFVDIVHWLRPSPSDPSRVYVLAVTSMPDLYTRDELDRAGVDDCLVKPLAEVEIRGAIERMRAVLSSSSF